MVCLKNAADTEAVGRFVYTSEHFLVLPDPKMGYQPHTAEDAAEIRESGGYFIAWWVHPLFHREAWCSPPPRRNPA